MVAKRGAKDFGLAVLIDPNDRVLGISIVAVSKHDRSRIHLLDPIKLALLRFPLVWHVINRRVFSPLNFAYRNRSMWTMPKRNHAH